MNDAQELLLESAREGDVGGIEAAVDDGATVGGGAVSAGRRGALHLAALGGHLDAVKVLLRRGADPTLRSTATIDHGGVALHLAAGGGHAEVMDALLKGGADTEARDDKGRKAVHIAAYHGQLEALEVLQRHNCNLSAQSHARSTALHYAAAHGDLDVVKWLVRAGVRLDCKDKSGRLAKDVAKEHGHSDVQSFLKDCVKRRDMDASSGQRLSFRVTKRRRSLSMSNLFRGKSDVTLDRTPRYEPTPAFEPVPRMGSPTQASEISSVCRDPVVPGVDVETIRKVEDWRARRVEERENSPLVDVESLVSGPSTRYHPHPPDPSTSLAPSAPDTSFTYMQDDHLAVLRERDHEIYRLQDRLRQYEEKLTEAGQREEEVDAMREKVRRQEVEVTGLQEEVRQREEERALWEAAVRKLNHETRTQVTEAKREADVARKEAEEARQETDKARREMTEARREVDEARQEADEARRRPDEDVRESNETKQKLNETKQELDDLRQEMNEVKEELREARREADEARKEAEEVKQQMDEEVKRQEDSKLQMSREQEEEKLTLEHRVYTLSLQNQQHMQFREHQARIEAEQVGMEKARLQRMASLEATVAHLTHNLAQSKGEVAKMKEVLKEGEEERTLEIQDLQQQLQEYKQRNERAVGGQEEGRRGREVAREGREVGREGREVGEATGREVDGATMGTLRREVQGLQQRLEASIQHLTLAERKQQEQEAQSESIIAALRKQVEALSQGQDAKNNLEAMRARDTEAIQRQVNAKSDPEPRRVRDIEAIQREVNAKLEVWRRDFQRERESNQRQLKEVSEQLEAERKNWTRTLDLSQRQLLDQNSKHAADRKQWTAEKETLEKQLESVSQKHEAERKEWLREKETLQTQVKALTDKRQGAGENAAMERQMKDLSEKHDMEKKALSGELEMARRQLEAVTTMLSAAQQKKRKQEEQRKGASPRQERGEQKHSVTQLIQELVEAKRDEGRRLQKAAWQNDDRGPDLVMSAVSASGLGSQTSSPDSQRSTVSSGSKRSILSPVPKQRASPGSQQLIRTTATQQPNASVGPTQHASDTQSAVVSAGSKQSTSVLTQQTSDTQLSTSPTGTQHSAASKGPTQQMSDTQLSTSPTGTHQSASPKGPTQHPSDTQTGPLGNNQYMNAILQCLYSITSLREFFTSNAFRRCLNPHSANKGDVAKGVARVFASISTGDPLTARRDTLRLQEVIGWHKGVHTPSPSPHPVEPATALLAALHDDLTTDKQQSVVREWMWGRKEEVMRCGREGGGEISRTREFFTTISLPLYRQGSHISLQAALWQEFREKAVDCKCTFCGHTHPCLHHTTLTHLPSILVIHFNRNSSDLSGQATSVEFPAESLTLTQHMKIGCSPSYELFAVVSQEGVVNSGRYTAFCRSPHDPTWRLYQDLTVTATSLQRVLAQTHAHVLFYRGVKMRVTSPLRGQTSAV